VVIVSTVREERTHVLDLLPTGLWSGGALALARVWLVGAPPQGASAEDAALLRWGTLQGFPELLTEGLLAGVAGSLVLIVAANRGSWPLRALGFALAATAAALYLAGFPPDEGGRALPGFQRDVFVCAAGAALVATLLAHTGNLVRGRLALVVAALVAVVLQVALARALAGEAPQFEQRRVVLDLVASPELWGVLEQRPGAPPVEVTLTPHTDPRADVADKQSIRMAPPCAVGFDVPTEAGVCTLHAAAGADRRLSEFMAESGVKPFSEAGCAVDYSVEVDGQVVWTERVHHPGDSSTGPEARHWRHVGGKDGLALRPGQRVVLRTAWAPGQSDMGLAAHDLVLGFGGVRLEAQEPRARTLARRGAPHIVWVQIDGLRIDRLGCYGARRRLSPRIDRMAAEGTQFQEAYATSNWSAPANVSLLTGLTMEEHGVFDRAHSTLQLRHTTLAEALQAKGFTTGVFRGDPGASAHRHYDQGFEYVDLPTSERRSATEVVASATSWLQRHATARCLVHVQFADLLEPRRPSQAGLEQLEPAVLPPPLAAALAANFAELGDTALPWADENAFRSILDQYDACLASVDRAVGFLVDELADRGLADRTLVCLTAGHGEMLMDGVLAQPGLALHAQEVRVPLLLAGPGIPPGRRVAGAVSARYAAGTLARLGGAGLDVWDPHDLLRDPPRDSARFGTRLGGAMDGEPGRDRYGLRAGEHTLHWDTRTLERGHLSVDEVPQADLSLFRVSVDPYERTDLIDIDEGRARELLRRLQTELNEAREAAKVAR